MLKATFFGGYKTYLGESILHCTSHSFVLKCWIRDLKIHLNNGTDSGVGRTDASYMYTIRIFVVVAVSQTTGLCGM